MQLEKLNHFEKFNLKTSFAINEQEMEATYLKLQQQFHPDKQQDNQENQIDNEINSILINEAYQILKNPIKRAIYLLQLQNINIEDESSKIAPEQQTLLFVIKLREEILDCQNQPEEIAKIKEEIKNIISKEMSEIGSLLTKEQYLQSVQKLIKVKYLDKIIFDLKMANK